MKETKEVIEYILEQMEEFNLNFPSYVLQNNGIKSIGEFLDTDIEIFNGFSHEYLNTAYKDKDDVYYDIVENNPELLETFSNDGEGLQKYIKATYEIEQTFGIEATNKNGFYLNIKVDEEEMELFKSLNVLKSKTSDFLKTIKEQQLSTVFSDTNFLNKYLLALTLNNELEHKSKSSFKRNKLKI